MRPRGPGRPGPSARAVLLLCALLAIACGACGACGSAPLRSYDSRPGPYDRLSTGERERFERAQRLAEAGESDAARELLSELSRQLPRNLTVAVRLQELELESLEAGGSLPPEEGGAGAEADEVLPPGERLLQRYRRRLDRARSAPGRSPVAELVLVARLTPDPERARGLLDEALEWDANCNWAHYGEAHLLAQAGDVLEAMAAVDRALDLDPGHLPARRLETRLLQRSGQVPRATNALEQWIADARVSPAVRPREFAEAQLDLAALYLLGGEASDALDVLARIDQDQLEGSSALGLLEAAAHEGRGDPYAALASAATAAEADPSDPLPLVQMALVHEYRLGDPRRAGELWGQVAHLARTRVLGDPAVPEGERPLDASSLLIWAEARVRVERHERALAAAAGTEPR